MIACIIICQKMSRKDLRKYVLAHRNENEALQIYMERMQTESV